MPKSSPRTINMLIAPSYMDALISRKIKERKLLLAVVLSHPNAHGTPNIRNEGENTQNARFQKNGKIKLFDRLLWRFFSPYYKKHKQDSTIDGLMTEEGHHCPLSEKCPYYKAVKEGKTSEINWEGEACPMKDKW